jgi:hypothetical protein
MEAYILGRRGSASPARTPRWPATFECRHRVATPRIGIDPPTILAVTLAIGHPDLRGTSRSNAVPGRHRVAGASRLCVFAATGEFVLHDRLARRDAGHSVGALRCLAGHAPQAQPGEPISAAVLAVGDRPPCIAILVVPKRRGSACRNIAAEDHMGGEGFEGPGAASSRTACVRFPAGTDRWCGARAPSGRPPPELWPRTSSRTKHVPFRAGRDGNRLGGVGVPRHSARIDVR